MPRVILYGTQIYADKLRFILTFLDLCSPVCICVQLFFLHRFKPLDDGSADLTDLVNLFCDERQWSIIAFLETRLTFCYDQPELQVLPEFCTSRRLSSASGALYRNKI